jgi:iron-sulfur cluster assembly accessory protein
MISISKSAINRFSNILKMNNSKALLFGIKSGGCSGFEYYFEPTNDPPEKLDEIYTQDNVTIHICGKSLFKIMGIHIDVKKDIMGEGFTFENPNATNSCGCGSSFNSN